MICSSALAAEYSFVQISDTQIGLGGFDHDVRSWRAAVDHINSLGVDFAILTGDMVQDWDNQDQINIFRSIATGLTIPMYLAPGNHDVGAPAQFTPTPQSMAQYRANYGPDYYSFVVVDDVFIVVNTNFWRSNVPGETILHDAWLVQRLAEAASASQRVFVLGHHPLYTVLPTEPLNAGNIPPDKRAQVLQWFVEFGVDAYLSGHLHQNRHFQFQGIPLITSAGTSVNYGPPNQIPPLGFRVYTVSETTENFFTAIRSPDVDFDGHVDGGDFATFDGCAGGPDTGTTLPCSALDLDGDADVDRSDFSVFQTAFTGD